MIRIEFNDDVINARLDALAAVLADLTPVMQEIGRFLVESTKQRFRDGMAPDSITWPAKSEATLARSRDARPLWGPSGMLSSQIHYGADSGSVEVGSNMAYAAMMQFGGTKAAFPHLWGDIPARPFLGLSETDRAGVLDIIAEQLEAATR